MSSNKPPIPTPLEIVTMIVLEVHANTGRGILSDDVRAIVADGIAQRSGVSESVANLCIAAGEQTLCNPEVLAFLSSLWTMTWRSLSTGIKGVARIIHRGATWLTSADSEIDLGATV